MPDFLWLVPAIPLAGFITLALWGSSLNRRGKAVIGVGSVGSAALLMCAIAFSFISEPPQNNSFEQILRPWVTVGSFSPVIGLYLDPLSLVMALIVTVVGFLIHLYSVDYMADDEGFGRFFAYMNLFVSAMLILVLADNFLLLYLGWEGVGLCSYLLIGFWYKDPYNGSAAIKAFVTTRIGDAAMAIGLFVIFSNLETLQIQDVLQRSVQEWPIGSTIAVITAALLLAGALGKSAQLPLQVWLPDAMAGPTPVSALIHAATMVTAGVYLIARTHVIFELAPIVQTSVAVIGTATLLIAGLSALAQSDIKRVLAYSTISQIGYMFLALGVGAWSAAMFHFFTHAFFKALLFLAAGSIIVSLHHEQNIFKMGGLAGKLPVTFLTFLIGAASLSSLPLITAGFYSKDAILWAAWASPKGAWWLWAGAFLGAFITALYSFRLIFLVFWGQVGTRVFRKPGTLLLIPLIILALFSITAGFLDIPHSIGNIQVFSGFLSPVFSTQKIPENSSAELIFQLLASAASILGILAAYVIYVINPDYFKKFTQSARFQKTWEFFFSGWGFDELYAKLVVNPIYSLAKLNKNDAVDYIYTGIGGITEIFHHILSGTQTGKLRHYAMGIVVGAIIVIAITVLS